MSIYSKPDELERIGEILRIYARLPFSRATIPGSVMEGTLALIRGATVLPTYDFVDVVDPTKRIGWQIKATLSGTPVTWKRVKLRDGAALITKSREDDLHVQALRAAVIAFCNESARSSLDLRVKPEHRRSTGLPPLVQLDDIGIARLILHPDGWAEYYERRLITRTQPQLFDPRSYKWKWTDERVGGKQLPALHGIHISSNTKHFAWHGQGENQLHYYGEREWWPDRSPTQNTVRFRLDGRRLTYEDLARLLAAFDKEPEPEVVSSQDVENLPLPRDV